MNVSYTHYRRQGLCGDGCGQPSLKARCQQCASRAYDKQRSKRTQAKQHGLCQQCCKRKAIRNTTLCDPCADHKNFAKYGAGSTPRRFHATNRTKLVLERLKREEPILRAHWNEVQPWIKAHIFLWTGKHDPCLKHSIEWSGIDEELHELTQVFNTYLDGIPNYLENGIRLGADHSMVIQR